MAGLDRLTEVATSKAPDPCRRATLDLYMHVDMMLITSLLVGILEDA